MKNKHIGSDAREMINGWEEKKPQIRKDIEKTNKAKIAPLTKTQIALLKRRTKEIMNSRRWIVCSPLTNLLKNRGLYYRVESNCYTMDIGDATLFKSSKVAAAVGEALDNVRKGKNRAPHMITLVRVNESGRIK